MKHRYLPNVSYYFFATDYLSSSPLSGMDVSVCGPSDLQCNVPFGRGQTDATGLAALPVHNPTQTGPFGINGYLQLVLPGYVPTLLYWGYPLSESIEQNNWQFITPANDQQLASSGGDTLDPTRGQMVARVWDCLLDAAPGVVITTDVNDPKMSEFYGLSYGRSPPTDSTGLSSSTTCRSGRSLSRQPPSLYAQRRARSPSASARAR